MSDIFLGILNVSITASWLILAIAVIRPLLKKAPKWICCALWALAAIRLVCPFSFKSVLSLIPSSQPIPQDIASDSNPAINSGISVLNNAVNPVIADRFKPDPAASANPLQIVIPVLSVLWIAGMIVLLLYALVSFMKLRRSVGASIPLKDNILACDEVRSPFILGVFKPVIYVPSSMSGETLDYVITHEKAHLKRYDHLRKPLGYILLTVYWFNPLCWIAYILLCRDIEMACDEKVIRDMDKNGKAAYAQALLNCNFPRKRIAACPLAFGEVGVKERVKSVLDYKKPAFWIIVAAVAACIVVGVCFLTDPSGTALTKWSIDEANMNAVLKDVRSMDVLYGNYAVACKDEDISRFISTMDKIKVGSRPVSQSRAENRSMEFTIIINESLELHMNEKLDEIWIDNGVKPSFTYPILNPATAEGLLQDFDLAKDSNGSTAVESEGDAISGTEQFENESGILSGNELQNYLAALPDEPETLAEEGCFVISNNDKCYGTESFSEFMDLYHANQPAAITIGQYTIEGDLFLCYVAYDGERITVTKDSRRDEYADSSQLITTDSHKYFSVFEIPGSDGNMMISHDDPEMTADKVMKMMASSTMESKESFCWIGSFSNNNMTKSD